MKTIKTQNKELIVVEIGEHVSWSKEFPTHFTYKNTDFGTVTKHIYTPWLHEKDSLQYFIANNKILGKLSELSEEECSRFVEFLFYNSINMFKNYKYPVTTSYPFLSAKESLISLLQSEGVDTSNPNNLLLIEKL